MNDFLRDWSGAVMRAWHKMMKLALPKKMYDFAVANGKHHELAGAVLLGWLLGIAAVLAGGIFSRIFNRIAGSFIFALLAWLFMYFHDHARGDGLIAARISGRLPGEEVPAGIIIPVFMMILKFALLMGLFYAGSAPFCGVIIAGSFAIEALLLADAGFSPPVFAVSEAAMHRFWIMTVLLLIFTFTGSKPAAALTILGFAILLKFAKERLNEQGLTADDIRFYGAMMIWVSLASGILTL